MNTEYKESRSEEAKHIVMFYLDFVQSHVTHELVWYFYEYLPGKHCSIILQISE
jgi:hypothetical protein